MPINVFALHYAEGTLKKAVFSEKAEKFSSLPMHVFDLRQHQECTDGSTNYRFDLRQCKESTHDAAN